MGKDEFLEALRRELYGLPPNEIERSIAYYSEMIDDRIEDGMTEFQAVEAMEDIDTIAKRIRLDQPLTTLVRSRMSGFRFPNVFSIILIILGFPVWFPLLCAALVVVLAFYIVIFSIIISLFAVVLGLCLSGIASILAGIVHVFFEPIPAVAATGAGFVLTGIGLLLLFPSLYIVKGILTFTKRFFRRIKALFIRKD